LNRKVSAPTADARLQFLRGFIAANKFIAVVWLSRDPQRGNENLIRLRAEQENEQSHLCVTLVEDAIQVHGLSL
jgi:hypothetical protein